MKKSRLPAAVAVRIGGPTDPGTPAPAPDGAPRTFTSVVPAGVPSLTQRPGPCPATSAPKKSLDPTAVKSESAYPDSPAMSKSFSSVVPRAVPLVA